MQALSRIVAGMACAAAMLAWPVLGQSVRLAPRMTQGQALYVELTDELEQTMKGDRLAETVKNSGRQTYGLLQKTESVSDDKCRVSITYDRAAMATSYPTAVDYDSDRKKQSDATAALDQVFAAMIGKSITLEIGKDGRSTSITGYREILEAVDRSASGSPQWAAMRPMMSPEVFKVQFWDKPHALYPNREVKAGDTWSTTLNASLPLVGAVKYDYDCKLTEIGKREGREVAVVEFAGKMTMPSDAQPLTTAGPMSLKIESGTMKGSAQFDVELGQFSIQTHETEITFTGRTADSAPASQPVSALTLTQYSKSTLRVMTPEQREKQKSQATARPAPTSRPAEAPASNKAGG